MGNICIQLLEKGQHCWGIVVWFDDITHFCFSRKQLRLPILEVNPRWWLQKASWAPDKEVTLSDLKNLCLHVIHFLPCQWYFLSFLCFTLVWDMLWERIILTQASWMSFLIWKLYQSSDYYVCAIGTLIQVVSYISLMLLHARKNWIYSLEGTKIWKKQNCIVFISFLYCSFVKNKQILNSGLVNFVAAVVHCCSDKLLLHDSETNLVGASNLYFIFTI